MRVKDKKPRNNYVRKNPEQKSDLGYISLVCVCCFLCCCVYCGWDGGAESKYVREHVHCLPCQREEIDIDIQWVRKNKQTNMYLKVRATSVWTKIKHILLSQQKKITSTQKTVKKVKTEKKIYQLWKLENKKQKQGLI